MFFNRIGLGAGALDTIFECMGVEYRLLDIPLCYTLFIEDIYPSLIGGSRKCLRDSYSG